MEDEQEQIPDEPQETYENSEESEEQEEEYSPDEEEDLSEDLNPDEEPPEENNGNQEENDKEPEQPKPTNLRDFTTNEIKEISTYIQANVPYSVLETIFPLTENVINKVQVFITVYRIINSSKNYTQHEVTKQKLQKMLDECKDEYDIVYKSYIRYQSGGFGSNNHYKNIIDTFEDIDKKTKIDNLIDAFLLFAEKQTFFSIDKISGIESSRKGGGQVVDKLIGKEQK